MLGSQTLEVAIGLIALFSSVSLFATAVREMIESGFKQRGKLIHDAMEELFKGHSTVGDFYKSITISPLFSGQYLGRRRNLPSYIVPRDFATTVIDLARRSAGDTGDAITKGAIDWVDKLPQSRIRDLLDVAARTAGTDSDKVRAFLEQWFEGQMERVSGWYKRITQWILLIIGAVTAAALNIDATSIAESLYRNDALREVIVAEASAKTANPEVASSTSQTPSAAFQELRSYSFPIGWSWTGTWPEPVPQCAAAGQPSGSCSLGLSGVILLILGWAITAVAVSLGAPFWFDLLNKFMVIRSTVKPFEKSLPEGSEDNPPQRTQVVRLEVAGAKTKN